MLQAFTLNVKGVGTWRIGTARELARSAGLKNVTFIASSFASLNDLDLPACDFITLNGVWSWIDDENRARIAQCINAKLKPGGVLYVSYNALPGHAGTLPLRQLMRAEFARAQGSASERIAAACGSTGKIRCFSSPTAKKTPSLPPPGCSMNRRTRPVRATRISSRAVWRCSPGTASTRL